MNFKNLFHYWRVVLTVAELTLRHMMNDSFVLFVILVQPIIIAVLAMFMLRDTAENAAMFVVVGSGLTGLWSSLLFISGNSINGERWQGTLESLIGAPTPFDVIVFGKNLANVIQSLLSMTLAYLLAALFFGYQLAITQPFLFIGSLFIAIFAFISFGLIIAPVFVMYREVQHWQNAMEYPVYILAGFLFPVLLLPKWTTPISYALPPYWAAVALHGTTTGNVDLKTVMFSWAMMIGLGIMDLFIASKLFKFMLYKTRVDATLDVQ